MVRTGGAPGALGKTLASATKSPDISVSRFVSTTSPIAAVPPGCAPLAIVDVNVFGSTPTSLRIAPEAADPLASKQHHLQYYTFQYNLHEPYQILHQLF